MRVASVVPYPELANRLEQLGKSGPELARITGVDESTGYRWLAGGSKPYRKYLTMIADATGVHLRWLETGEGEMRASDVSADTSQPSRAIAPTRAPAADSEPYAGEDADLGATVAVPQYGHVGAGNPRVPPVQIGVLNVTVAEYALDFGEPPRVIGNRYKPSGRFGYFIIDGDSAAPVYFDRERVPVQMLEADTRFANDLVYVFRWQGEYQIKRLRLQPGGVVRATSLNPSIDPFTFRVDDDEDFAVVALARASPKQELYTALVGRFLRIKKP